MPKIGSLPAPARAHSSAMLLASVLTMLLPLETAGAALEDTVAGAEGGEASEPELQEAVLKESSTQRRAVSDSGRP